MSILVNKESKVLIQGITGTQASFHVKRSMDYGTNVVAGVTPGKGGSVHLDVPVLTRCVKQSEKPAPTLQSCMFRPNSSRTRYARQRKPNLTFASALPTACRLKTCLKSRKCCAVPKPSSSAPIHRASLRPAKHGWAFSRKHSPSGSYRRRFALINPYL